ncbi:MAG: hypothetical protein ACRDKW_02060 [Actinomycetota bacterium]
MVDESADPLAHPNEPRLGPAAAGDDLQRLIEDMRHKGLSAGQLEKLRTSWEAAAHDPMNKGRGGPTLPENSPHGRIPLPTRSPEPAPSPPEAPEAPEAADDRPEVGELRDRTTPWPGPETTV